MIPCDPEGWIAAGKEHGARRLAARGERLKRLYGLTLEDFERIRQEQGCACAVCGVPDHGEGYSFTLFVDHNHETGKARGLLCSTCNTALGIAHESVERLKELRPDFSPERLESFAEYLEHYGSEDDRPEDGKEAV